MRAGITTSASAFGLDISRDHNALNYIVIRARMSDLLWCCPTTPPPPPSGHTGKFDNPSVGDDIYFRYTVCLRSILSLFLVLGVPTSNLKVSL